MLIPELLWFLMAKEHRLQREEKPTPAGTTQQGNT
jgi:hypothetical protein